MLNVNNSFYLFGGQKNCKRGASGSDGSTKIGRLDLSTKTWFEAGKLNSMRMRHGVAFLDSSFLVIGSSSRVVETEKCTLSDGKVTCKSQQPRLDNYSYILNFIVPLDYCK